MNTNLLKLNLGCGGEKLEGYHNVDWNDLVDPDQVLDLNQLPYPFESDVYDEVHVSHVLEHLDRPFAVMKELHRILKPNGFLRIKVPHFSRGFTHCEHAHGFDVTFPNYFNPKFIKSGYFGIQFHCKVMRLSWMAHEDLLVQVGVPEWQVRLLKGLNVCISSVANASPLLCSRLWCFWVGGFEQIEFIFQKA